MLDALVGGTGETSRCGHVVILDLAGFSRDFNAGADSIAIAFDADGVNQNPMVAVLCGVVKQFGAIANS
jgi:hypothetical protein